MTRPELTNRTLYISFDGALQPLGHSQVVRLLVTLSMSGQRYTLVTLERSEDLAQSHRVRALEVELQNAGIRWIYGTYKPGGTGIASNLAQVTSMVHQAVRAGDIELVHARGYQPGTIARGVKSLYGIPYIFDFRGLWIDERLEEGRWFANPIALTTARRVEKSLFDSADAIVSLAEPGAELLRSGNLTGRPYRGQLVVIPTAVDFKAFSMSDESGGDSELAAVRSWVGGGLLLGWVGSINRWYNTDASLSIVRRVLDRLPNARLLCLTQQREEMESALTPHNLGHASRVVSVSHGEIPRWVRELDWGLQIMGTSRAKAASMPTKFAEFIASGVRPIHHGCNDEVTSWVERCGTGYNLPDLSDAALDSCATHIATSASSPEERASARSRLESHFSLDAASRQYQALYNTILRDD